MHDAIIGERMGLPSVGVMTTAFESAGALMARVLGAADFKFVTTAHPISSATNADLAGRAEEVAMTSRAILCKA